MSGLDERTKGEIRASASVELEAWCWSLSVSLADAHDPGTRAFLAYRLDLVRRELQLRERMHDPVTPLRRSSARYDLERIKTDLSLVEALPRLAAVDLKPSAGRYAGRCPFPDHHDGSPSLSVRGDGLVWHCFGCGRGGDLFTFAQHWYDTRSFMAAVELAVVGMGQQLEHYRIGQRPAQRMVTHVG